MSNAFAIAAVTAVVKRLLENGLVKLAVTENWGSDVLISVVPPDRVTVDADERLQLNLFLYQITPYTGLRRAERFIFPLEHQNNYGPLAFDLHYLLTAYGARDFLVRSKILPDS